MGTDHSHAGLPFSYRSAPAAAPHVATDAVQQPTCRAISLDELTRRGPVVVLAASHDEIAVGAAGLVMATLDTSYASLFTLRDAEPASNPVAPKSACAANGEREPGSHREPLLEVLDEGAGRQRLRCRTLRRGDGGLDERAVEVASDRVADEFERLCAGALLVATVPMASADHRFLDQVARRVGNRSPGVTRWHFAALRQVPAGAVYQLRSAAAVRTLDARAWTAAKERMQCGSDDVRAARARAQLPELFWQDADVSALSRIGAAVT